MASKTKDTLPKEEEDYISIDGESGLQSRTLSSQKASGGQSMVRSKYKASSSQGMETQKIHPILASMGFKNQAEISALLRDELIALRSGGRHEGSLASWKHIYTLGTAANVSTVEASTALCAVTGGSATNNRITNTIRLRKLRLRYRIERVLAASAPTAITREPVIHIYVWRDKIPVTPGTAPVTAGTDANPPASATLMFSRLGAATVAAGDLPVRNPITEDAYHLYDYHKVTLDTHSGFNLIDAAAGTGMPGPMVKMGKMDIDLNEVEQNYPTFAATAADTNNLWITFHSPTTYSNQGYQDTFAFTSDIEFEDVQD